MESRKSTVSFSDMMDSSDEEFLASSNVLNKFFIKEKQFGACPIKLRRQAFGEFHHIYDDLRKHPEEFLDDLLENPPIRIENSDSSNQLYNKALNEMHPSHSSPKNQLVPHHTHHHTQPNSSYQIKPFTNPDGTQTPLMNPKHQELALLPRRPSALLQEILTTRRPSAIMAAFTTPRPNNQLATQLGNGQLQQQRQRIQMGSLHEQDITSSGSSRSFQGIINMETNDDHKHLAIESRRKNRRIGDDALSTALSALYCKLVVILGIAMPITEILSSKIPAHIYQGFYAYLYLGSIMFVGFVYLSHCRTRAVFSLIKSYHEKTDQFPLKKRAAHFGSFYLRVGAIAFAIGNMVHSGLEIGQYFELKGTPGCTNIFVVLTPAARMALAIVQMQFIFLNTTELDMARHKVVARFGLMHMIATNLCEWLYVLIEETKHEIFHLTHGHDSHFPSHGETTSNGVLAALTTPGGNNDTKSSIFNATEIFNATTHEIIKRSAHFNGEHSAEYIDCRRTNIMGKLVQNASPFLFPCTIEYSLICAVILYEMWKKVRSLPDIERSRRNSQKHPRKSAHHFSIDCARSHRGMFAGIILVVLTIISLIMYFVLNDHKDYAALAIEEVTIVEILMYVVCSAGVIAAMVKMRDLKFQKTTNDHHSSSVSLDCTLLVLAQSGVYVYAMFSIMGCYFAMQDHIAGGQEGLIAEILCLIQTSIQTLFVLNASWRRCKGKQQSRSKPGREIVTFLLVANMALWFINTLIKGQASFRPTHLEFFGLWAWTVITHVSMPLAIFYRFHSTICLFEIWKSAYKVKSDH